MRHPARPLRPSLARLAALAALAALASLALPLAGCPGARPGPGTPDASPPASAALIGNTGSALMGNTGAAFNGTVSGPADLIGNTGAALIGNTGAALVGNTVAALVGNSGGAYRLQALEQQGLASAFIYLTSPDERFYAIDGKPVTTTTDAGGRYDFGRPVVPEDQYVIVNAMLSGNRRLVGFTVAKAGQNRVDVDVATTYVLEFLRYEARRAGKTFADYDLGKLPSLVERTGAMLADGRLGLDRDHLVVGQAGPLVDAYVAAMAKAAPDLRAEWRAMLGAAPIAAVRFAGTGRFGFNSVSPAAAIDVPAASPLAVLAAGDKAFLALTYMHQLLEIGGNGLATPLTALTLEDPALAPAPPLPEDGTLASATRLPEPQALAADSAGNLYLTLNTAYTRQLNLVLMICAEPSPKFGRTDLQAGRIYRIAGTPEAKQDGTGFRGPGGLAVDAAGNLFVADRLNDRIMRVDRQTGAMAQVAGISPLSSQYPTLVDGDQEAGKHGLFRPTALVWRRNGPDEELFVMDSYFQRIRLVRAPSGDWGAARMSTLAGSGKAVPAGEASVVPGGFAGDGGPALEARFHFARVDTADWRNSEWSRNGMALDARLNRLYVADLHNGRVRAVDLASGKVWTVAGGGSRSSDGLGSHLLLDQPTGLAVANGGDLLVSDLRRHVVWRIVAPD